MTRKSLGPVGRRSIFIWTALFVCAGAWVAGGLSAAEEGKPGVFNVVKRSRVAGENGAVGMKERQVNWRADKTAIIVCDMWDKHWCAGATRRVGEMAPRLNAVLEATRKQGALIIHAPSGCLGPYEDSPARKRAKDAPTAGNLPKDIGEWCHKIPPEDKGVYPIDQSDGGCDCQPKCKEGGPWKSQVAAIPMDMDRDAVSDSGVEIWNLLEQRGIEHVILAGVHTNMCVLGRPFGLRQLSKNGKDVVLMRDMTDTMYNSRAKPFVNHFRGTELIVQYIEQYVCPTISSEQIVGGTPFAFSESKAAEADKK